MADIDVDRLNAIIEQAGKGKKDDEPALVPRGMIAGGATDPDNLSRLQVILDKAEAGTLPTEAQQSGLEAPKGAPGYGPRDAIAHGLTMGGSDVLGGYVRDIAKWQPWGTGVKEIHDARDRYATEHPYVNAIGNLGGGMFTPLGPINRLAGYAAPAATRLAERLGVSAAPRVAESGAQLATRAEQVGGGAAAVGTGALTGAGMGAIGGALDEFPEGRAAALDAALQGGIFGGAIGGAVPIGAAAGLAGWRGARDYMRPQSWWTQGAKDRFNARALQGEFSDLPTARTRLELDQTIGSPKLPGYEESLAQKTGDVGFRGTESDLIAGLGTKDPRLWTPAEAKLATMGEAQNKSRTDALGTVVDPAADPLNAQIAMQETARTMTADQQATLAAKQQADADLMARQQQAQQGQQQAIEQQRQGLRLDQQVKPEETGRVGQTEMSGAAETYKADVRRPAWEAIDPEKKLAIDINPFAKQAKAIEAGRSRLDADPSAREIELFGKAKLGGTAVPLEDIQGMRRNINDFVMKQNGPDGDKAAGRRGTLLRQALDDVIDQRITAAAEKDPALQSKLNAADPGDAPFGRPDMGAPEAPKRPQDLFQFLMSKGGLKDEGGELASRDLGRTQKGLIFGRLANKNGMELDAAREAAAEAGFIHPDSDINDFLYAVNQHAAGKPVFREGDSQAVAWLEHEAQRKRGDFQYAEDMPPLPGERQQANRYPITPFEGLPNWDRDAIERYRSALSASKTEKELFDNKFIQPLLQTRGTKGDYQVAASDVGSFVVRNNESAQAFLEAGGTPQTLRNFLLDDLASRYGNSPTEANLATWRRSRADALRASPGLSDEVSSLGATQAALDRLALQHAAEAKAAATETAGLVKSQAEQTRDMQQGRIASILKADPADVGNIIGKTLQSDTAATQFMRMRQASGGDPGLPKAVLDHIANLYISPQTKQMSNPEFQRMLNQKEGAIRAAGVTPEGMRTLRAIADSLEQPAPGSPRVLGVNASGTPTRFNTMFRAIVSGQQGAATGAGQAATAATALASDVALTGGAATAANVIARMGQRLQAAGIRNQAQAMAAAAADPGGIGRVMLMADIPANRPIAEKALNAALASARTQQAIGAVVRQGDAERRTRERGRALLTAPATR